MSDRKRYVVEKNLPAVASAAPGVARDSQGRPLVIDLNGKTGRAGRKLDFRWNQWLLVYFDRLEARTVTHAVALKLRPLLVSRRMHVKGQCTRTQFLTMAKAAGVGQTPGGEHTIRQEMDAANLIFSDLCRAKNAGTNATIMRRRRINRALATGQRDYKLEPELRLVLKAGDSYLTTIVRRYFSRFGLTVDDDEAMHVGHGTRGEGHSAGVV